MTYDVRPSARAAAKYPSHFFAVAIVRLGFSERTVKTHARAFADRKAAITAAKVAIIMNGEKHFVDAALERMD